MSWTPNMSGLDETQQELKKTLDVADKILQNALAMCIRNMHTALAQGQSISFIGDITFSLYALAASCRTMRYFEGVDPYYMFALTNTMAKISSALTLIRNKLGASTLDTCCFLLYYDFEAAAKHRRADIFPDAEGDVPRNLLVLEGIFQTLLYSQSIMIVLFRKSSPDYWLSHGSIPSLQMFQLVLAKSLELQHESCGGDIIASRDFDPAGKIQNSFNDAWNSQQRLFTKDDELTGFHAQALLRLFIARKDLEIQLGPVNMSCAFVVRKPNIYDCPIVYASPAFETLTGYAKREILGQNCRFLQYPDGLVLPDVQRRSTNNQSLLALKHQIEKQIAQGQDRQLTVINYKKGGQPFANLLTVIPVLWPSMYSSWDPNTYFIGFYIDLAEHPGCILGRNANGTYRVDYSTTQVQGLVDVSTAPADNLALVLQGNDPVEPTELLSTASPEADSPWTVTDGPAPPYALSPGVFYHTSRMGMLSP